MKHRYFLSILMLLIIFWSTTQAAPEDRLGAIPPNLPIPGTLTLDGETYSRYSIIHTFLMSAISTHIPADQTRYDSALIPPLKSVMDTDDALSTPDGYRVQYPWLYEYMYRDKGMPRYAAINKWDSTNPVRVALGFPNGLKPYEWLRLPKKNKEVEEFNKTQIARGLPPLPQVSPSITHVESVLLESSAGNADPKVLSTVRDEIISFSAILSGETKLAISYLDHLQETAAQTAQIRIVVTTEDISAAGTGLFKNRRHKRTVIGEKQSDKQTRSFRHQIETYSLPTAVHFTPYSERQVDGYFLPNSDNTIGLSFCFIWQGHPPEMLKALVRECLLRSMGLPDATSLQSKGYLDLWNDPQKYPNRLKNPKVDMIRIGEYIIPERLSEYDRYMLRLLYSHVIKPGMSPIEVYHALNDR